MKEMLLMIIAVVTLCRAIGFWLDYQAQRRRNATLARLQADHDQYETNGKDQVLTRDELWLGWESMFLRNVGLGRIDETER